MALENDVQDLTQAIKLLAAAVAAQTAAFGNLPPPQPVDEVKKEVKKQSAAKPAETTSTSSTQESGGTATSVATSPSEDVAPEVSFEQLAAKFTDLIDLNRDAAVGLLKELGVAKLGLIDKAKYGSVFQQVSELLNG